MKYMFICDEGINRSPTGSRIAREMAEEKGIDLETDFMRLYPEDSLAQEQREREKLKGFDRIFVMTTEMRDVVAQRYKIRGDKVVVLDIEDDYDIHGLAGPQLLRMLENVFREKLDGWIK
tara:strand:+ start:152 stop:511 length:360 start_codon:yes stop_codon:yes gene_type:complete